MFNVKLYERVGEKVSKIGSFAHPSDVAADVSKHLEIALRKMPPSDQARISRVQFDRAPGAPETLTLAAKKDRTEKKGK